MATKRKVAQSKTPGKATKAEPRYTTDQARRELVDIALSLSKLNDNIVDSATNSDACIRGEALGDALQQVLGLRALLNDVAAGLVTEVTP